MADKELTQRQARSVYLITYSRARLDRFPTRESFSNAVLQAFIRTPATPVRWVCAREDHADGTKHYHMSIKLDRVQRWLAVKARIHAANDIQVHFSGRHANYYSAWQYSTKEDEQPLQSKDHPDLTNTGQPQTMNASTARQTRGTRKRSRLSAFDLTEIVLVKKIKSRVQLLALANSQRLEGKTDIAEFICNRGSKSVDDLIKLAWEMDGAQADIERSSMARMAILRLKRNEDCAEGCEGRWRQQAKDILQRNQIPENVFRQAMLSLLREGRGKYRNILVTGPANCGKSFLLQPLSLIYRTFCNPATTSFAWIGVDKAEIILLNDFRWSQQVIILLARHRL